MGAGSRGRVWWGREQRNGRQNSAVPIINVNAQEGQLSSSSVPILLADSCPEDSELKKDASFFDDFFPFINNFKTNHVAARRSVNKRILRSKEQAKIHASSETAEEETADDLVEEEISNRFEKLSE